MYTLDESRPAWAEINLDNLANNIKEVRRITKADTRVMAVVKANAYGHGSVRAGKVFLENGADRLAVATLSEAIELRKANINAPILILGYTPVSQFHMAIKHNIILTIYDYGWAKGLSDAAAKLGKTATIHIKIDSGMGRIGFLPEDESIEDIINISKLPNIEIEGVFTHFSTSDEKDKSYTKLQYERFSRLVNKLEERGLNIPIKHVSNSAAIVDFPEYDLDIVRPGIMLYGYYSYEEVNKDRVDLKAAMSVKAKISNLKTVPKGTGISYGKTFVTEKESIIATIPMGYADGFNRSLSSNIEVVVNGKKSPIVGRICMDQSMIDVTDIGDLNIGDEVTIFGFEDGCLDADDIAGKLGTISHEVLCAISKRVPRVYIKDGIIIGIDDNLLD